jgi:hypothetical protein
MKVHRKKAKLDMCQTEESEAASLPKGVEEV